MVKIFKFLHFGGSLFCTLAKHSSVKAIISWSSILLFFDKISFKKWAKERIYKITSMKEMLIQIFLKIWPTFLNSFSFLLCFNPSGKGIDLIAFLKNTLEKGISTLIKTWSFWFSFTPSLTNPPLYSPRIGLFKILH